MNKPSSDVLHYVKTLVGVVHGLTVTDRKISSNFSRPRLHGRYDDLDISKAYLIRGKG